VCEVELCPECGNTNILGDNEKGETVCKTCGLVLEHYEFTPPQEHTTKNTPTNPIMYTSSALGIENTPGQRTERQVAYDINRAIQKLELPHNMEELAIKYMRKILRNKKSYNPHNTRLTCQELTIASIWAIIKQTNHPISADEYTKKLWPLYKHTNLMKTQKRTNEFIKNQQNHTQKTPLIIAHINKIAAKLVNIHLIDVTYANYISIYAIQMIHTNPGVATNRRTNLTAAAALLAADKLLANRLQLQALAQTANTGTSNIPTIAKIYKKYAPPLPKEYAAIKFHNYLQKEVHLC